MTLIGILSENTGPSRAVRAGPVERTVSLSLKAETCVARGLKV